MTKARLIQRRDGSYMVVTDTGILIEDGTIDDCMKAISEWHLKLVDRFCDTKREWTFKRILAIVHPDKNHGDPLATRLTVEVLKYKNDLDVFLNKFRDELFYFGVETI